MQTYLGLKSKHHNIADRLAYIDFKLRFTGFVKRSDIGEMFNLSDAAASKLLAEYNKECPSNMEYNRTLRANALKRESYTPLLDFDVETTLGMLANGFNKNKLSEPAKTIVPFEKIGKIPNQLSIECIAKITRAISCGHSIRCCYYSENSSNHNERTIVPLAIMYDGVNWMFRGYHRHDKKGIFFKNFHFSRAKNVVELFEDKNAKKQPTESLEQDKSWNLIVPLQLKLHNTLSDDQKNRVRTDFGMNEDTDEITISVRSAYLWILEKKWFIDRAPQNSDADKQRFYKFKLINSDMVRLLEQQNL